MSTLAQLEAARRAVHAVFPGTEAEPVGFAHGVADPAHQARNPPVERIRRLSPACRERVLKRQVQSSTRIIMVRLVL